MKITNYLTLIANLKNYRISISRTQKDISERTGLSLHTIANLEGGKNVSSYALFSYIKALGLEQEFINFPPIVELRFEDLPLNKEERKRVRHKKRIIEWKEDKL